MGALLSEADKDENSIPTSKVATLQHPFAVVNLAGDYPFITELIDFEAGNNTKKHLPSYTPNGLEDTGNRTDEVEEKVSEIISKSKKDKEAKKEKSKSDLKKLEKEVFDIFEKNLIFEGTPEEVRKFWEEAKGKLKLLAINSIDWWNTIMSKIGEIVLFERDGLLLSNEPYIKIRKEIADLFEKNY